MLTLRNYAGDEYAVLATKKIKSELNGTEDLSLTIHQQKNNALDLKTIDKLWEIHYENIDYKIIHIKRQTRGNSFYLDVRAKPLFYWDFKKQIIHENHDGSHTANSAFRIVFENSGYNFVLVDFSGSLSWEGFGKGVTRMEMFKRLIDRYGYEFEIQGKTVYMRHMIGNDTNYMYKYKLNSSNLSENIDASGMFTHIKGFGDFGEGEEDYFTNAGLKRQYTSPLADIVTPPGKLPDEGKPIVDGRITNTATLDAAMKKAVDDSLQITVEGTLHDVRAMGYTVAVPKKGDRVWLHDERIDLEREIRLHTVTTTKDEKDNIISCDVTFGSQSIGERHKADISSLSKRFSDLLTGKLKLPVISLEQIGMDMINAIHAASSEITFGDFGMMAISKTNPNHVFGVNSEGWYISQDGGRTPKTIATAQGIYADALFAGTLWLTNEMNIESADGYLNMTGSTIKVASKTNPDVYTEISPTRTYHKQGHVLIETVTGRRSIIDGMLNRSSTMTGRLPGFISTEVTADGSWYRTTSTQYETAHLEHFVHEARWLFVAVGINNWGYDDVVDARMETPDGKISNYFSTETLGGGTHYGWLRIDLGEPLDRPTTGSVQIKFKSRQGSQVRMHISNRFLTDFPDNI